MRLYAVDASLCTLIHGLDGLMHPLARVDRTAPKESALNTSKRKPIDAGRRAVLTSSIATAAGALMPMVDVRAADAAPLSPAEVRDLATAPTMDVSMTVNGRPVSVKVDTRTTLLDTLREHLQLTGTKKGCDHGQCGACTVLVDGRRINSCLTLAVMHEGHAVTTIEGLGSPQRMHPMQVAFVKHDGFQCGYCTPGQICSAVGTLDEIQRGVPSHASADLSAPQRATPDEIRERMSGNLCRCGAYANILEAIQEVAGVQA